jgi:plastocyanin
MAHTDILLTDEHNVFKPSQTEVSVVKGDSITFSTQGGVPVALFFSPGAVGVLSPSPVVPTLLGQGEKGDFTFTSSEAGAYSVFFEKNATQPPPHYPVRPANVLLLEIDASHSGFGGPESGTRG